MKRLNPENINTPQHYEEVWENKVVKRPWFDAVRHRALLQFVKEGDRVLDVGAGVYGSCQYLHEKSELKNLDLVCADFSYTAKEIVEKQCPGIDYQLMDVTRLLFRPHSFDCVVSGETIEHIDNPAEFVAGLCRMCKPGGWITISTVDTNCQAAKDHGEYPEHVWEFTPEDLTGFFEPFGTVKYELVGHYHCVYCQLKK